jgi:trigger factor
MQVSVEQTSAVERRLTVGVPKERIEPEIQSRLKSLARQTKLNGFRPGKVPRRVVEQKYGQKVRQEVLGEVIQATFVEAVTLEKLRPVGDPTFDLNSDIKNLEQGLSYTVTFEVYQEITTLHVDGLPIEKPVAKVSEADIEIMLQRLRQQRQTWKEVDRPATIGDRVIIDFVGTINGFSFNGNEVKQVSLILGQNNFAIQEFEEKLLGVCAGEDRDFDLTFPPNHHNPQLAGRTVHFVVHVSKVATSQLPEINASFAKSFGVVDGSIESLRIDARYNMERELEYATEGKIKQQILDALLKANPIDVPSSLVDAETQRLLKNRQQEWQTQNLSAEMFKDDAVKRVKIGILISELISRYHIQVQPEKVRQLIERIALAYESPEAVVKEYYADEQRLKDVESMVLEDTVVKWLLDRSQLTEKQVDFYTTVMEPNQVPSRQVAN